MNRINNYNIMMKINKQIIKEKEEKIKTLFNQFELLKEKISVCQGKRMHSKSNEKSKFLSFTKSKQFNNYQSQFTVFKQTQTSLSHKKNIDDPEKQRLKAKMMELKKIILERQQSFSIKQKSLKRIIKQQRNNLSMIHSMYQRKLSEKEQLKLSVQQVLKLIPKNLGVQNKLTFFQKRLEYINEFLIEVTKLIKYKLQKSKQQTQRIMKEKIEIEIMLEEKKKKISVLQNNNQTTHNKSLQKRINLIENKYQQEIKLLKEKCNKEQLLKTNLQNQIIKNQQTLNKIEIQFREQIKKMNKRQQLKLIQAKEQLLIYQTQIKQLHEMYAMKNQQFIKIQSCQNSKISELQTKLQHQMLMNNQIKINYELNVKEYKNMLSIYNKQIQDLKSQKFKIPESNQFNSKISIIDQRINQIQNSKQTIQQIHEQSQSNKKLQDQVLQKNKQNQEIMLIQTNRDMLEKQIQQLIKQQELWRSNTQSLEIKIQNYVDTISEISRQKKQLLREINDIKNHIQQRQTDFNLKQIKLAQQIQQINRKYQQALSQKKSFQIQICQLLKNQQQKQTKITQLLNINQIYQNRVRQYEKNQNRILQLEIMNKNLELKIADQNNMLHPPSILASKIKSISVPDKKQSSMLSSVRKVKFYDEQIGKTGQNLSKMLRSNLQNITKVESFIRQANSEEQDQINAIAGIENDEDNMLNEKYSSTISKSPPNKLNKSKRMLYSYHYNTENSNLMEKCKKLQNELSLVTQQNNFLKLKKEKIEMELHEMEVDHQRYIEQKQLLKSQFKQTVLQFNSLKELIRKLFHSLFLEHKKSVKSNFNILKEYFLLLFKFCFPEKDNDTLRIFNYLYDNKRGIFSI